MALAYLEVTDWAEAKAVNHTYYLDGDRMLAYVRSGTSELKTLMSVKLLGLSLV